MRTLTKILAPAIAATLAIGAVAPATAAEWHRDTRSEASRYTPARNTSIRYEISDLRQDIARAAARRMISQREAIGLQRDVAGIQRLHTLYARNGLTRSELRILENKVERVKAELRMERYDRDGRSDIRRR